MFRSSGVSAVSLREQIIDTIPSLPSLPSASSEVIRLVRDPDVPNAKIAQTIEYDPSLTTNVLRLANSAYFGFVHKVGTVKEALFRLGTHRVFQMVVAATIGKMAQTPLRGYDLSGGDLWDHLIGTAIGSTKLAEALALKPPDYVFTAALTHDIGKIVLGTFIEVNATSIISLAHEEKISFEEAEQRILGIDHAEVGAMLLEHWNMPSNLVEVVRWHHQPENITGDPLVVNLVHAANVTCLMAGVGASLDALTYRPKHDVMSQLGLDTGILEKVVFEIINELLSVRKLFNFR